MSFDIPEYTGEVTGVGTVRLLEAIRESGLRPKFYQAASSEMFGKVREIPQRETTPFYPRSPYGAAKVYAYWMTVNYREAYNLFACNGILFNHESPRRGETFSQPEDHESCRPDQTGAPKGALSGESRRQAGLGLRRRLRPGNVADVAAGGARRLCGGDR